MEKGWTVDLNSKIAMLPTPTSSTGGQEPEGKTGRKLTTVLGMLPTIQASDAKTAAGCSQEYINRRRGSGKEKVSEIIQDGQGKVGLKLQPAFALWMMGYPEDWCDLRDGE
ncbi:MAG TPA: hypothetical protein VGD14_09635 [bacterium]